MNKAGAFIAIMVFAAGSIGTRCFAIEKRQGIIRINQSTQCMYQCDMYLLESDNPYAFTYLKPDGMTSINLFQYQEVHVEVTGYVASCSRCTDLFVTNIRVLPTVTDVMTAESSLPARTTLEQNYPNPFNPTTTIRYDLREPAEVKLAVFNILGDEVALLISGMQRPGRYSAVWDASGHPSGIYECRLIVLSQAGNIRSSAARMMYMK